MLSMAYKEQCKQGVISLSLTLDSVEADLWCTSLLGDDGDSLLI
jgi:hypothetical protein